MIQELPQNNLSTQKTVDLTKDYPHFYRAVFSKIFLYWKGTEKIIAWSLLLSLLALTLCGVFLDVLISYWNSDFYNAFQNYNAKALPSLIARFFGLVFSYIVVILFSVFALSYLVLRWRRWMTEHLLSRWLSESSYYLLPFLDAKIDNPDQRLAEDIHLFTSESLNLLKIFIRAFFTLVLFTHILWSLSGTLNFTCLGYALSIPGYLVWVALLYALGGTILSHYITKPLMLIEFRKEQFEGNFRYALSRIREYGESIAFYRGEESEKKLLHTLFGDIFKNYIALLKQNLKISAWLATYGQMSTLVPLLAAAPRYFAKKITLGPLMQIAISFGKVENALSVIVQSYPKIISWKASTFRLLMFEKKLDELQSLQSESKVQYQKTASKGYKIENLSMYLPSGKRLFHQLSQEFKPGESVLLKAQSGYGKSTFLRVLSGFWPFAEGVVQVPQASTLFLPQKPYLPLGTLHDVLCYPKTTFFSKEKLLRVLEVVGLENFGDQLDKKIFWSQALSLGEQQRLGFARLLLHKPDWAFLDEATSALDEKSEEKLYHMVKEGLPNTTIISVGHRSTLDSFHQRIWNLDKENNRE